MTFPTRVFEFKHTNPEGSVSVDITGDYCATAITDGFATAHYLNNTLHSVWHDSLSTYISSIIFGSELNLDVAIGALMLISEYQTILERTNDCVVDEIEDVMSLFVSAFIVADSLLHPTESIRLGQWKKITCGEWTMGDIRQRELDFRRVFNFTEAIQPAALSSRRFKFLVSHDEIKRVLWKEYKRELMRERELEMRYNITSEDEDEDEQRSASTCKPLRVTNYTSRDAHSSDSDSSDCSSVQTSGPGMPIPPRMMNFRSSSDSSHSFDSNSSEVVSPIGSGSAVQSSRSHKSETPSIAPWKVLEYTHRDPKGRLSADIAGEYCATIITEGFVTAHYENNLPHSLWHSSLSTYISSIIIGSDLNINVTIGALMLIRDYQTMLERINHCVVDEIEDVMSLFVSAYIVADTLLNPMEPVRLGQWKKITCGECTMQEIRQREVDFRRVFNFTASIHPDALSWKTLTFIKVHDQIKLVKDEENLKDMLREHERTMGVIESQARPPLPVIDYYCSATRHASDNYSTIGSSAVFVRSSSRVNRSEASSVDVTPSCDGRDAAFFSGAVKMFARFRGLQLRKTHR